MVKDTGGLALHESACMPGRGYRLAGCPQKLSQRPHGSRVTQHLSTHWGVVGDELLTGPGSLSKADGVGGACACVWTCHTREVSHT